MSGPSAALPGPLNMNGAGSSVQWDGAVKLSNPGLGKNADTKDSYLTEGESAVYTLPGVDSLDDLAFIGVRATSTTTPEGSIKAVSECEDHDEHDGQGDMLPSATASTVATLNFKDDNEPPPEPEDHVKEWPQDISNVVFYFDAGDGKTYNVKIDEFDKDAPRDMDSLLEEARAFIAEESDKIDPDTPLLGVSVKGGNQPTQYFAVDNDENGEEADVAPVKLTNTGKGKGNAEVLSYNDFATFVEGYNENAPVSEETDDELDYVA